MLNKTLKVGVAGFEPAASCSQSRRDNRATLHPEGYLFNKLYVLIVIAAANITIPFNTPIFKLDKMIFFN